MVGFRPPSPRASSVTGADSPPIYTKTGDDGSTGRLFGGRVSKADPIVELCGTLDEAVAALGLARAMLDDTEGATVLALQRGLFVAAADLAANPRERERLVPGISRVTSEMTTELEQTIDRLVAERPLRPAFVVPGATSASAALDVARTLIRRAERQVVAARQDAVPIESALLAYLNRASDLAYALARRAAGLHEEPLSHD